MLRCTGIAARGVYTARCVVDVSRSCQRTSPQGLTPSLPGLISPGRQWSEPGRGPRGRHTGRFLLSSMCRPSRPWQDIEHPVPGGLHHRQFLCRHFVPETVQPPPRSRALWFGDRHRLVPRNAGYTCCHLPHNQFNALFCVLFIPDSFRSDVTGQADDFVNFGFQRRTTQVPASRSCRP